MYSFRHCQFENDIADFDEEIVGLEDAASIFNLLDFVHFPIPFANIRHGQLENDIAAYDEEIVRLEDAASIIAKAQEDNKKNQGLMSKSLVHMVNMI